VHLSFKTRVFFLTLTGLKIILRWKPKKRNTGVLEKKVNRTKMDKHPKVRHAKSMARTAAMGLVIAGLFVLVFLIAWFLYGFVAIKPLQEKAKTSIATVYYSSDNIPIPSRLTVVDTLESAFKLRESGIEIDDLNNISRIASLTASDSLFITDFLYGPHSTINTLTVNNNYTLPGFRPNDKTYVLVGSGVPNTALVWATLTDTSGTNEAYGIVSSTTVQYPIADPSYPLATTLADPITSSSNASGLSITTVGGVAPFTAITGFNSAKPYVLQYRAAWTIQVTPQTNPDVRFALATDNAYLAAPPTNELIMTDGFVTINDTSLSETAYQYTGRTAIVPAGILQPSDTLSLWLIDNSSPLVMSVDSYSFNAFEL
jgi:hypothetical protein